MDEARDFDLLAASLRADAGDTRAFVEALATKLTESFPEQARVERKGGLFGGERRVRSIALDLGERHYLLEADGGRVECRRRTVVHGIALKTDELPVDAWIDELSRDLFAEASRSERGRLALERLLGG